MLALHLFAAAASALLRTRSVSGTRREDSNERFPSSGSVNISFLAKTKRKKTFSYEVNYIKILKYCHKILKKKEIMRKFKMILLIII